MKTVLLTLILAIGYNASGQTFKKLWETDTLLMKPESAIYDPSNDVIYVSNINGMFLAKDGNGFISKINPNGRIETLEWVKGLDNPQGLGIFKNKLYVADINRIVVIDIKKGAIENAFKIDSAKFLNDITTDSNGDVYVSDCFGQKIYKLADNKISLWFESPKLLRPNGLLSTKQALMILNMGDGFVYSVDKRSKYLTEFSKGIINGDGIVSDGTDGYFVSNAWGGNIYHINSKGEKNISLAIDKIIAADIEYIPAKKMILIPTLDKKVIAYTLE